MHIDHFDPDVVVTFLVLEMAVGIDLLSLVFFLTLLACAFLQFILLSELILNIKVRIRVYLPI